MPKPKKLNQIKKQRSFPITKHDKAASIIKELNGYIYNPTNTGYKIIQLLKEKPDIDVTTIYTTIRDTQSNVSQKLNRLKLLGIVNSRRQHKHIYYSISEVNLDLTQYVLYQSTQFLENLFKAKFKNLTLDSFYARSKKERNVINNSKLTTNIL